MNRQKRVLPYLLLNILVSALTTLAVLWWWNSTQVDKLPRTRVVPSAAPQATALPVQGTPTLPPLDQAVIEVSGVFGAGDVQSEVLELKRVGAGSLRLTGWQVQNNSGQRYTFPDLSLNENGKVQVYSRAGADTVIELHWGLDQPAWQPGEAVTVLDPQGNVRATYQVP